MHISSFKLNLIRLFIMLKLETMESSEKTIHQLYTSIANGDPSKIEACYAPTVKFYDPTFGNLSGDDVPKMWKMLIKKSNGNLKLEYTVIKCDAYKGTAQWIAIYAFGKDKRTVKNVVRSEFHFKDGLIIKQNDDFNIWTWSKQALGLPGILLGWTGYLHQKIRKQALSSLKNFS